MVWQLAARLDISKLLHQHMKANVVSTSLQEIYRMYIYTQRKTQAVFPLIVKHTHTAD